MQGLLHEEADEDAVVQAGAEERGEVVDAEGRREIGEAAGAMEEPGRPRGEGAEEQDALAVQVADVEVRAAEGAGVGRGRTVDFSEMAGDDGGVFTDEPLAGDGEGAEALRDGEAGGLQERQRAAAGADEHEAGAGGVRFARGGVAHGEFPVSGGTTQVCDALAGDDAAIFLRAEPREELAGELAEIYVGAGVDFGGGDGLVGSAFDEQRRPAANDVALGAEGHRAKKRMCRQSGVTGAEESDLRGAADETQVRHGADEIGRARCESVGDGVAPELARLFEAGEDLDGLGDVDRRAGSGGRRCVVEFAETGVAGAGVVPAVGALAGELVGRFVDVNREARVEPLEHDAEVRGHDAAADEEDVGGGGRGHGRRS